MNLKNLKLNDTIIYYNIRFSAFYEVKIIEIYYDEDYMIVESQFNLGLNSAPVLTPSLSYKMLGGDNVYDEFICDASHITDIADLKEKYPEYFV